MIVDPLFYMLAIPSLIIIGLSKGGFTGIGALSMPLMAIVASPLQVSAIIVPILLLLDIVAVWNYRTTYDRKTLLLTIPPSLIGVGAGWALAARVDPAVIRMLVGFIALAFTMTVWFGPKTREARDHSVPRATFWSAVTGFTSFVALTGAPPYQIYLLPLKLPHRVYAGTFIIFMAVNNVLKIGPFIALGQFNLGSLATSAALFPVALAATFAGMWLVKRVANDIFYKVIYILLFILSVKLIWDGAAAILMA